MNFTRDTYEQMKDDFEDDNAQNYEIVLPDDETTTLEFEGLVTELPLSVPTDGVITADATIKVSGAVTLDSGSGPSAGA
jgi:predicted secreted protein